ncbi:MAG TPA: NAD-dependent epimerase/dehydratase family protein, partial [Schlesneria sp.]
DVADAAAVLAAASDCDVVFHVAAKAGVWGTYESYHLANVVGTENVLSACRTHQIPKLVYTSSPSVVFSGSDEAGINESAPYPHSYLTHYPKTKAIAERGVLAANGERLANGGLLSTVALRPHLIWGPGDNHLVPRLIERARTGKLRRVGSGKNLVDTVYIDNAAEAHILAAQKLEPGSPVAGKAYFITNGEPVPLWDLINRMLACANLPPVKKHISANAAYMVGAILEAVYKITGRRDEPPMTRFVARQLATAHWFDISAARNDFGYAPAVTIDEGLKRLALWLRDQPSLVDKR